MGIERIDYEKCTRCGHCFLICPMDVIRSIGKIPYIAYGEDCMSCYLCDLECNARAITVSPERSRPVSTPF